MMKHLRTWIAQFKLGQLRKQVHLTPHSFRAELNRTRRILILLPAGLRELTLVKQYLPTITTLFKSADITLLAIPGVAVTDIYPRKGFQLLTPTADELTWSGLAKSDFLKKLQQSQFELVIDMNLEYSHFTSSVLLQFPNAVRVGRGNHLGSPYYNLEIKSNYLRDERNIYRTLLETLAALMNRPVEGMAPVAHN